jgi:hypothetical protein
MAQDRFGGIVLRYLGVLICLATGMLCMALALGQVGAEANTSQKPRAGAKKKAAPGRATQKHNQKRSERSKNDPHKQKHFFSS